MNDPKLSPELKKIFEQAEPVGSDSAKQQRVERIQHRAARELATRDSLSLLTGWLWALLAGFIAPMAAALAARQKPSSRARKKPSSISLRQTMNRDSEHQNGST